MIEISDPFLREKWKITVENINNEYQNVIQLSEVCQSFKYTEHKETRKDDENNLILREYLDRRPSQGVQKSQDRNDMIKNIDKRWERFGGKPPFSYLNEKDDAEVL
jgi:hypothetical protein